jgi:hypothetical protein
MALGLITIFTILWNVYSFPLNTIHIYILKFLKKLIDDQVKNA